MKYQLELSALLYKRQTTQNRLNELRREICNVEEQILTREYQIKLYLEKEIERADLATSKTRFSNAEKRKLELERYRQEDKPLRDLKEAKALKAEEINNLECQDKIERIQERYLFKEIELYIINQQSGVLYDK